MVREGGARRRRVRQEDADLAIVHLAQASVVLSAHADTVRALLGERTLVNNQHRALGRTDSRRSESLGGHGLHFALHRSRVPHPAGQEPRHGNDVALREVQRHRLNTLALRREQQSLQIMKRVSLTFDATEARRESLVKIDEFIGTGAQIFLGHDPVLLTMTTTRPRTDPFVLRTLLLGRSARRWYAA